MNPLPKIMPLRILKDGLRLTKANFLTYLPLLLIITVLVYAGNEGLTSLMLERNPEATLLDQLTMTSLIFGLLLSPVEVGLMLIGLSAARGERIKIADLRHILPHSAKIIVITIITMALVQAGFMLLFFPGIFLTVVLSMAPMLMCDKKLSMVQALKMSAQAASKQWFMLFLVYLWLVVAILLSFYTMGFALIFTLPLYLNVKGLLYQQLFDSKIDDVAPNAHDDNEFEA